MSDDNEDEERNTNDLGFRKIPGASSGLIQHPGVHVMAATMGFGMGMGIVRDDFILVSEFSEHLGPVPSVAFPETAITEDTGFDIGKFVIRIMSVDNQARVESETFVLPEDNEVFLTELEESAYAYVRHVTLFDIHARGFVRPVCLSYITSDPQKIMIHFDELSNEFAKVSDYMKVENHAIFFQDLQERLGDLVFTKNFLTSNVKDGINVEGGEFNKRQSSIDNDGDTVTGEDAGEEIGGDSGYSAISKENVDSFIKETQIMIDSLKLKVDYRKIAHQKMLNKSVFERRSSQGEIVNTTTTSDPIFDQSQKPEFKPKILKTFHKTSRFDDKLRTIEQMTGIGYQLSMNKLQKILAYFKRQNMLLLVEKEENPLLFPHGAMLSIGKNLVSNFLEGAQKGQSGTKGIRIPPSQNLRARDSDSLSTGSFESASSSLFMDAVDGDAETFLEINPNLNAQSQENPPPPPYSFSELEEGPSEFGFNNGTDLEVQRKSSEGLNRVISTSDLEQVSSQKSNKPRKDKKILPTSFVEHLWQSNDGKAGMGIVAFKKKYTFSRHLIFALLKGRPVIIHGHPDSEKEIRNLIQTLSLFVPGNKNKITPWRTKAVTLIDLAKIKLVGLTKQHPIPKNVERYASILDFETETLKSPQYNGVYVEQIMSRQKHWVDDNAFLAHLHCVFLDLSMKAYIYYHACSIGCPQINLNNITPSSGMSDLPGTISNNSNPNLASGNINNSGNIGGGGGVNNSNNVTINPNATYYGGNLNTNSMLNSPITDRRTSPNNYSSDPEFARRMSVPENHTQQMMQKHHPEPTRTRSFGLIGKEKIREKSNIIPSILRTNIPQAPDTSYPPQYVEKSKKFFNQFDVAPNDREIIEYLAEVVKEQQVLEMNGGIEDPSFAPTIKLDFKQSQKFKNPKSSNSRP